jgi:hypothetical protein
MTDSQSSLNELPALLEERRRYEAWLLALEARRESTPQHVFDRVQSDYRTRLAHVAEQLSSHRQAIEVERDGVQSRLSVLASEEGLRRDQRAELELRAHVGELAGPDADSAFATVDQSITQLVEERRGLATRITELELLLIDRKEAAPPALEPAPLSEAKAAAVPQTEPARDGAAAAASDVAVAVDRALEPRAPAPSAPPAIAPHPPHPPHAAPAPPAAAQPTALPAAPPAVVPKHVEAPAAAPPAVAPVAASANAAPTDVPRPRPAARQSFDELAFLSSVVGKNDGGAHAAKKEMATAPLIERRSSEPLLKPANIVQEENAGESLLAGIEHARLATGEHPLAANVPSNTPIILRPSNTVEQAKTLKCNECGGLNYPTEWYCERCGAELAAL